MTKLSELLLRVVAWFHGEKGQDMVEYALITAVLSIAIVLATAGILTGSFTNWATDIKGLIEGAV